MYSWACDVRKTDFLLLAHLSQRLIGDLIGHSWSGVRPSSSTMLKDLLRNRGANQSQNLCGASLGRGNEILFAISWSHDQDGRQDHIRWKPFKNLLRKRQADFHETWYVALWTPAHHSFLQRMTLERPWPILPQGQIWNLRFSKWKSEHSGFFRNYCTSGLKVGRSRNLIEFMKVCEYLRSR